MKIGPPPYSNFPNSSIWLINSVNFVNIVPVVYSAVLPPSLMVFFFLQNPNRFEIMRMMNRWRDTRGVCCQVPKLATLPPFLTMGSADFCLFLCFTKIKSQNCSTNTLTFKSSLPKFAPMSPFPTMWSAKSDISFVLYFCPEKSWSKYFESLLIPSFYCSLCLFLTLLRTSYKDVSSWSKYHVSLLIWRLSCQLGVSQTLKSPAGQRKGLLLKLFHLWTQTLFQANTNKYKNRTARSAIGMVSYWKVQLLIS